MADNLEAQYLSQNRTNSEAYSALDELLQRNGVDRQGNPVAKPVTPAQPAGPSATQAAAGAAGRIRQIRKDQAAEVQPSFMRDVVAGTGKEVVRGVVGGVQDALKELFESADSIAKLATGGEKTFLGSAAESIPQLAGENTTTGGKLLRGITQFGAGFGVAGKGLKAAGVASKGARALGAGAFADAFAFDPEDPNISNLVQSVPGLANPVTEFLATQPGDNEAINRLKRAVEGLGLGVATEGVIQIARNIRARTAIKRVEQTFEKAQTPPAATVPEEQAMTSSPAAPPSAASQIDVVRPPEGMVDIPVGTAGRGGVMHPTAFDSSGVEQLRLPAPGQAILTVDEMAESLIKERKARQILEGNPTLQAAQEAVTISDNVRGNPTLRAAQETMLTGQSTEEIAGRLIAKEGDSIRAIIKDQGGEVSTEAVHTLARAAVGGAIGLTQGETIEDRIGNALLGAGAGAALKPALLKKLIGAIERVAPKEFKMLKSFDAPTMNVTTKGMTRKPPNKSQPIQVASEAQTKDFLAADPDAIQVGNKAIKINWDAIEGDQHIDDVIKTLTKLNEESIDVARRGVQSDEKRRQLANMLGMTEDDMLRRRQGQALNAEQIQAFVDIYGSAAKELDRLAIALKSGEQVEAQFRLQLGRVTALTETVFGAKAESGRALRVWGQAAQQLAGPGRVQQGVDMLTLGGKNIADVPAERLADMILALDSPAQKTTFIRQATELGKNAILEAWMNGLLSNPVTHFANTISNSMNIGVGVMERAIAGAFGKEVARSEAGAMLHGLTGGWLDALKLAKKAFIEGKSQMGFSKLEQPHGRAISAENFGLAGGLGRAVDMLGTAVTVPGRALMAADDFFKGINMRMELHAQAARQSAKEGLSGTALAKRIDELAKDTDFASLVKDQTEAFANYQTFNQQLGFLGSGVIQFLNEHPTARVLLPFVRTPVNIAKYTIERTPLVNLAMKQFRDDLAVGGVRRDMAIAKTTFGGMMYLSAGYLAMGGYVTGGGPVNKELRNLQRGTGWQPYSFKIGDTYVSFSRLDPLGFMFGLAADLVEKGGELDELDLDGLTAAGVMALKETFINKTYMKGVADAFEAITSPNRKWQNYFERLAGSVVPAGVAAIARQIDPTLREVNSAADAIFSRLPGFSSDLPPRRNIWGDPIMLDGAVGPDLISPLYTSQQKDDPVTQEILRLELGLAMPPNYIFGTRPTEGAFAKEDPRQGVKLTPEEYDRYVQLSAEGLKEKLSQVMQTGSYQNASVEDKKTLIQRYFNIYRDKAEEQLKTEFPELNEAVVEKFGERMESRRPGSDTGASPFTF